jgi:5-methylcytosine-specific restriction protein A
MRAIQLIRKPLCVLCIEAGRTTPSMHADHILPTNDGGASFDFANLRSLCHECHSRVTRAWQQGKPEPKAKAGVDAETGQPVGNHWWNDASST